MLASLSGMQPLTGSWNRSLGHSSAAPGRSCRDGRSRYGPRVIAKGPRTVGDHWGMSLGYREGRE